jgi:hypothetical protein
MGSLHDQIAQLIEQVAEEKANAKINKFIEYVSATYEIELAILLRNYQNISQLEVPTTTGRGGGVPSQCIGFNKTGSRCKLKGKYNGRCHHHKVTTPRQVTKGEEVSKAAVVHDHPGLYSKKCPACIKMKKNSSSSEKLLIEI